MSKIFEKYATHIVVSWVILLSVTYSALSLVRHTRFQSGGFDLGLYDQAVWQYSQFLWPYNTIKDRFILGDHLTLTIPLLSPLYWLWNDVRMLLIFQAVWISVSTVAIFKLTLLRKFSLFTALVISVVYSLFYGIQYAVFFDFHPVVLGVGLLTWFVYFFESRKNTLTYISGALILLTQENMGLLLVGLGLVYLFHKKYRRAGIFFILSGVFASLLASKIIALFSPNGFEYWPQIARSPVEIVRQFFDQQEKRQVWFYSLSWFSFLPLLSPGAMLAVLFDLAQYFVTGPEFSRMWSPFMHHRITLAPLLTLGTVEALALLKKKRVNIHVVTLVLFAVALVSQYGLHLPVNKLSKRAFWVTESWMDDNRQLIRTLSTDMKLATQQNLASHVSHRQYIYLVWPREHDYDDQRCGQRSCWWLDFDTNADYLLLDVRPNQTLTQILETNEHFQQAVANMEVSGKISLAQSVGNARLYRVNKLLY